MVSRLHGICHLLLDQHCSNGQPACNSQCHRSVSVKERNPFTGMMACRRIADQTLEGEPVGGKGICYSQPISHNTSAPESTSRRRQARQQGSRVLNAPARGFAKVRMSGSTPKFW